MKRVKNIQKFLEPANYYQQFIKYFAAIARPLSGKKRSKMELNREVREGI